MNQLTVINNLFDPGLVRAAAHVWPGQDDPGWVRYDSPIEKKRSWPAWQEMPSACCELLRELMLLELPALGFPSGLIPDLGLHGSGLHDHGPGEFLGGHLDADRHLHNGLERRVNAILFLDAWREEWGGQLELWSADRQERETIVLPGFNRLVLFRTTDTSYHRVAVVNCPPAMRRCSLAAYWWGRPPSGPAKRRRADFIHLGREPTDPEEERARRERRTA